PGKSSSTRRGPRSPRGNATCSRRAAAANVQPCNSSEMMTTTNATSKYKEAFDSPTSMGTEARKIATAPRSPVQAMKLFSRQLKRNGARQRNTATGRATCISTTATITAGTMLTTSRCGDTNSPSSTNMTICANQVAASRNVTTELCAPAEITSTSISVRNTANGSLVPDSASSVAPTRGRSRRPGVCTSRNTAAASVDATTAPTNRASVQLRSSAHLATGAVIIAVSNTPIVASAIDGASTARML